MTDDERRKLYRWIDWLHKAFFVTAILWVVCALFLAYAWTRKIDLDHQARAAAIRATR